MASIWDIIKIKSIAGVEKVTEEQKNLIISDAVSNCRSSRLLME